MKKTIYHIATLFVAIALAFGMFSNVQASPQGIIYYKRLMPGNLVGWDFEKRSPLESITATAEGWICTAGGYPENTHYARIRYKLPEQDWMALTSFYIKEVIVLPPDFYSNLESELRIFNTDNYGTTVNGIHYGANTLDELRVGIYIYSNGIMHIAGNKQGQNGGRIDLWNSGTPIPVGEHTFELAGSLDTVAPWYFKIDGVLVGSGTAQMSPDVVPSDERVITRMVAGIDGASDQDTKPISVLVKRFEFSDYIPLGQGPADLKPWVFGDVPNSYWASQDIERLYHAGITSGCIDNPLRYCPQAIVTRAQMSVFLEKGIHGSSFAAPTVPLTFGDTASHWARDWIEALKNDGITAGCGAGKYCPEAAVTRAQMAIFLLRAEHGANYSPPPPQGVFLDVPTNHWAAAWIERLAAEGITSGCGNGNYCPDNQVTRAQMAVFFVNTFNLP